MAYEIDFLPVGDGERSGDAIALRYSHEDKYVIHVVDGGTIDAGKNLVQYIRQYYGNPRYIDHVVLTHADDDHSSGLREILQNFEVGALWMNRPWLYASEVLNDFRDARWSVDGLTKRLRQDFPILVELENLAYQRRIPIYEVFQGAMVSLFVVLSPSRQRYLELISQFSRTPAAAEGIHTRQGLLGGLAGIARQAVEWVVERWNFETLEENPETSASNESSVVQIANLDGDYILLTGDTGVISLTEAADYATALGVPLPGLRFIQIPHHGSRRNVSPSVLNRWIGEPVGQYQQRNTVAFVSAAKNDPSHPRKKVTNAFIRRGIEVCQTKGAPIRHQHEMEPRSGWFAANKIEFSMQVES